MRRVVTLLLTLLLGAPSLHAQEPIIPVELRRPNSVRLDGSNLTFCVTTGSAIEGFERDVATAIAGSLLLEPVFVEVTSDFPMYEETDLMTTVYQLLNERCEAYVGFNVVPDTYPTWLALTRPYATVPYTFVVVDERYTALADVPKDRPIGTPIVSVAESAYIAYASVTPATERWQRFPYADEELMLRRLLDGTIEGAFFWEPSLSRALEAVGPEGARVRRVATDPVRVPAAMMGVAVLANQDFLLDTLDRSIASLVADGTVAALLERHGIVGEAGP